VLLTLILAGVFQIAGLLPASWFGQSRWFSTMCLALVPSTAMMTLREHVRRLCLSQVAAREILALDAPIAFAQLLLLFWLAQSGRLSANTALLAVAAACLVCVVWLVAHRSEFKFRPSRAAIHWSYNLQFGRWLLAVSIAWLLADSFYRWIVGWQYVLDGLGRFASAQAVVLFINPLLLTATNFGRALSANRLATGGMPELRRFTFQATLLVTIIAGIAFLALAAVGGPLVRLIFGDQYGGLGGIVATLCLGMLVRIAGVPIDSSLAAHAPVGAPATWVLSNHDVTRPVTRYGRVDTSFAFESKREGTPTDLQRGTRRARAAGLLAMALPGSMYVYQGEELGLPEVEDIPSDRRQDPMWHRSGGVDPGRDGCRVPLPWAGQRPPFAFSDNGAGRPWLDQPDDWAPLTVEAQAEAIADAVMAAGGRLRIAGVATYEGAAVQPKVHG